MNVTIGDRSDSNVKLQDSQTRSDLDWVCSMWYIKPADSIHRRSKPSGGKQPNILIKGQPRCRLLEYRALYIKDGMDDAHLIQ